MLTRSMSRSSGTGEANIEPGDTNTLILILLDARPRLVVCQELTMDSSFLSSYLTPGDGTVYIGDVQLQPTEHGLALKRQFSLNRTQDSDASS